MTFSLGKKKVLLTEFFKMQTIASEKKANLGNEEFIVK